MSSFYDFSQMVILITYYIIGHLRKHLKDLRFNSTKRTSRKEDLQVTIVQGRIPEHLNIRHLSVRPISERVVVHHQLTKLTNLNLTGGR